MKRDAAGSFTYSPTDIVRFHGSAFASWMDRLLAEQPGAVTPDPGTEQDRIIEDLGVRHEAAHLESLRAAGKAIVEIVRGPGAQERTRTAMRAGVDVIFQAALGLPPFAGYADFLERVPGASDLGDFHYEVSDTKLAASEKPSYLLQLCAYAEMLEAAQGRRPEHVHVVLRKGAGKPFRTDDFFFVYGAVKRAFLESMAAFDAKALPEPDVGGDWGRWTSEAEKRLVAADHLALVAGVRSGHVKKLVAAGISTVAALARSKGKIKGIGAQPLERLREQARLQLASRGKPLPAWTVVPPTTDDPRRGLALLPPPSALDVYFDMEGYPLVEGGLEYLFGAATNGRAEPEYADWWAHDPVGEGRAFAAFVSWVMERRARDPGMHVYHYAAYERSALRRLMGRHARCEDEVDTLLREGVLVDLYAVVRQGLRIGTPSYSLKEIEVLYGREREAEVRNAGDSIVAYHRWIGSGEAHGPADSPLLAEIRDYNREDCLSTRDLLGWLRGAQAAAKIAWVPPGDAEETAPEAPSAGPDPRAARRALAEALRASLPDDPEVRAKDPDRWHVTEMLSNLVEFHRREAKPVWWSLFDRDDMDEDERVEDPTCLADLRRERRPAETIKRSKGFWYGFDPHQETRVREGSKCKLAGFLDVSCSVEQMDEARGRILLKLGASALAALPGGEPPSVTSLLLHDLVPAKSIEESIARTAQAWHDHRTLRPAVRDLLLRRPPCVHGHTGGPLVRDGEDPVAATVRLVGDLTESVLCVQGPPGTGKTYTAARAIAALVAAGRRVGVTSNSHKAILNLLDACADAIGTSFRCLKVGPKDDADDAAFAITHPGAELTDSAAASSKLAAHRLIAGTAWYFSRPDAADTLDVLFVDEAGQVSLANLLGMAPSAKSLVLLGDPMQLSMPTQGTHPGESGLSALDYALTGHATVPPDFGVFLPTTRRLHPDLCTFISGAFYEDRLCPAPGTEQRVVRRGASTGNGGGAGGPTDDPIPLEAGLLHVPVPHDGNGQRSDEEVAAIAALVAALLGRTVTDVDGRPAGPLTLDDILVVAPYNLQVRALEAGLPAGARVGTVDRFQGQEARVAIVSLTASDAETAGRGLEFVLDRRRLNVAISRAQSLAIVVGSPTLARARCGTVEQMRLLNTLCRIEQRGEGASRGAVVP